MLAFLIPVKHPARARSYELVMGLLRQTLASINNQSAPSYHAYVVCNQAPAWARQVPNSTFCKVSFPPPAAPHSESEQYSWVYRDKGCRVAVALDAAQRDGASHVMVVDADDFVSSRLAAYVAREPAAVGWYMQEGLIYSRLFKIAAVRSDFWWYCGTSQIVRSDLLPGRRDFGADPSLDTVVNSFDPWLLEHVLGDHAQWRKYFASRGHALEALPFIGAVWQADTGENSSRAWWSGRRFGPVWGTPLTSSQSEEFRIPLEGRGVGASLLLQFWRLRLWAHMRKREYLSSAPGKFLGLGGRR